MDNLPFKLAPKKPHSSAFSLVELLVVIAIISVMLAVAASVMSPSDGRGTSIARDIVVAHLHQARSNAISTGTPTAVVIAPANSALRERSGRILGLVEVSKTDNSTKLLSRWEELPKKQLFIPQALVSLSRPTILEDPERLIVEYRLGQGQSQQISMPYVLFGSEGTVIYPVGKKIEIAVGPGILRPNGQFQLIGKNRGKETVEIVQVSPLSGKVRIISPSQK